MKFFDYAITFREMPFNPSGSLTFYTGGQCKHKCQGCSWGDVKPEGEFIPLDKFRGIVKKKRHHTDAVCFLGEGSDQYDLVQYLKVCKDLGMKTMLYTGGQMADFDEEVLLLLDYIKVGEWQGKTLYDKDTNQIVYSLTDGIPFTEVKFYEM